MVYLLMMHSQSGIYKIVNAANGKYYLGSTNRLSYRWYRHRMNLRSGKHKNPHLQSAWNKYGDANFQFFVVEYCPETELFEREVKHLKECEKNPNTSYNLVYVPGGGSFFKGRKHSEETKRKMSERRRGENHPQYGTHLSASTKSKIASALKKKMAGRGNPRFDTTIYRFRQEKTGKKVEMTRYDFYSSFSIDPSNVNRLLKGKIRILHGWVVENSPFS